LQKGQTVAITQNPVHDRQAAHAATSFVESQLAPFRR
jgi:hypothetical protein